MATITVTPDQDTVLAEIHIAAPPERVFQAISDPNQLKNWWGQREGITIRRLNATSGLEVSGVALAPVTTARSSR